MFTVGHTRFLLRLQAGLEVGGGLDDGGWECGVSEAHAGTCHSG
jgi:hypothetical protein